MPFREKAMIKTLFVFGTRPEAIKLAPLIRELGKFSCFAVRVCITAQHREMLDQVLRFFNIRADYDLDIMKEDQDLSDITRRCLEGVRNVLEDYMPDLIIVQGDTTSTFAGALAGFYKKIKIAHIEAGLRSRDKYSPFPEEVNRTLTGHIADLHFAPTEEAVRNLKDEGIAGNVYNVGNTVIDALHAGLEIIRGDEGLYRDYFSFLGDKSRAILVTGHRRESFGRPFEDICSAIRDTAKKYISDVEFVYPVHLNPNVREPVYKILGDMENIHLIEPLDYPYLIYLLDKCFLVLTDSGGIQEEAPALGKPVIVMRNVTERMEGIRAGSAVLAGNSREGIRKNLAELLENKELYSRMSMAKNPYGDGTASIKIRELLKGIYKL